MLWIILQKIWLEGHIIYNLDESDLKDIETAATEHLVIKLG